MSFIKFYIIIFIFFLISCKQNNLFYNVINDQLIDTLKLVPFHLKNDFIKTDNNIISFNKDQKIYSIYIVSYNRSNSEVYQLANPNLVQSLLNQAAFKNEKGDIATCEDIIYFFDGNQIIFKSNICLKNKSILGLQNQKYGWVSSFNTFTYSLIDTFELIKF